MPVISKLFDLSLTPMGNKPQASVRAKLHESVMLEWLLQQGSPSRRGTPTNVKELISAILLKHKFPPSYTCEDNDMNCFLLLVT